MPTPVKLLADETLPPVAVQFTPARSLVVAVTESPWVMVSPPRAGDMLTVMVAGLMASVRLAAAVSVLESATLKVELKLPVTVGVPVIAPVEAFSDKPPGRVLPLARLQV